MVSDTQELRAAVFKRTGIAIDEHDPIMAVLAVSAQQTEEIGSRLLARISPVRIVAATAAASLVFGVVGGLIGWRLAYGHLDQARAEWNRQQADPTRAALIASEEGKAGIRLAELGVAVLLANCNGRRSWRIQDGYCIPASPRGAPDGFRISGKK